MTKNITTSILDKFTGYSEIMENALGNELAAYSYGVLSEFFFFVANLGVILIPGMDSGTGLMIRGISCLFIAQLISQAQNIPLHLSKHLFKVVTIRNIFVGFHILLIFYCIGKIQVSLIYVIEQTAPIWIFIINYFQYGQSIRIKEVVLFLTSMLGVMMITFPDYFYSFIYTSNESDSVISEEAQNDKYWQGTARVILVLAYSLSILSFSFGLLYIKKVKEPVSVIQIIFNQGFLYLTLGSILSLSQKEAGQAFQISYMTIINGMILIGTFSYVYQIMYLRGSIIVTNHGKYAMTGYSAVIFSYIYEILILGEIPDLMQIVGLTIIIVSLVNNK